MKTKIYELHLHSKQGDDLSWHVERARAHPRKDVVSEGLRTWARSFKDHHDRVLQLAQALAGKNVNVDGDVGMIRFDPEDTDAEKALEMLVAEGLLTADEFDDEDEA